MQNKSCDVVIVGAGPAGSIAARDIAKAGFDVLVVERKQEIGPPKRCAEGINVRGLLNVGVKPDPRWAAKGIYGAVIYFPNGKSLKIDQRKVPDDVMDAIYSGEKKPALEPATGYVLERKIFEKHLAADAIRAGARYMVKTRALDVIKDGGKIAGITAEQMGEKFEIRSKIVVAADGVDSRIAKSAGINTTNKLSDYHSGFQYEMAGLNIDPDVLHIFFGNSLAPKGYVWIFPKGQDVANVGIGILGSMSEDGKRAKDYLDKFIESRPEVFKNASAIEMNAGGVPVSSSIETFVADNFMIIGDAAQLVNPIHGGGIAIAMNSGALCAKAAVEALKENDTSREKLYAYEKKWRETDGVKMKKLLKLRAFLEKLTDEDMNKAADIVSGEDITKLTDGNYRFLFKTLLTKAPSLLSLAKKFLS